MSKHTAGPWATKGKGDTFTGLITSPSGTICSVIRDSSWGSLYRGAKGEDNANLIAAATEMQSALETCMKAIQCVPRHKGEAWDEALREAYQEALAAVNKSKGES